MLLLMPLFILFLFVYDAAPENNFSSSAKATTFIVSLEYILHHRISFTVASPACAENLKINRDK